MVLVLFNHWGCQHAGCHWGWHWTLEASLSNGPRLPCQSPCAASDSQSVLIQVYDLCFWDSMGANHFQNFFLDSHFNLNKGIHLFLKLILSLPLSHSQIMFQAWEYSVCGLSLADWSVGCQVPYCKIFELNWFWQSNCVFDFFIWIKTFGKYSKTNCFSLTSFT